MKKDTPLSINKKSNQNKIILFVLSLWIVFILLSITPFIAENFIDTSAMDEKYEYHLTFPHDGKQGHYYVERFNTNQTGQIHVIYTTESNSLEVDCKNIKVLRIYCREMYEKKSEEIFKRDPALDSNYYKTYFIDRDHFQVHVITEQEITSLTFIDTPIPYNVSVNDQEWWLTGINYTYTNNGIVLTKVPAGHSYVDIYFRSNDLNQPVAKFTVSSTIIGIGESISFDATSSYDPDGEIISYSWDLSDGTFKIGVTTDHSYQNKGIYNVILMVKDDDYLIGRAYQDIIVTDRVMNISKSVDKVMATPGSVLTYTITPTINKSWQQGVNNIIITDILPDSLDYIEATPSPQLIKNEVVWNLGIAFETNELNPIKLRVMVKKDVENKTLISNSATLDYESIEGQQFPQEVSNSVNTVVNIGSILAPKIRMPVPNIELHEDDPPQSLFLTSYEQDFHDSGAALRWYITGENESLYILSGEYSDNDELIIIPLPNAYGNNLVTLWLVDSDGYTANQPLWINITPVNDAPILSKPPDLIVHYDEAYTFDYKPYINDIDNTFEQLELSAIENIDVTGTKNTRSSTTKTGTRQGVNKYTQVNGLKVTYEFPKKFLNKLVFVSLIVSDRTDSDGNTIQINVTDDYTPQLVKELPDIFLDEGEVRRNAFDLDDYFMDPDRDSLFYTFGETHVTVHIKDNHEVDISSASDWFGIDTITFRARDPIGALAEDTIIVTVVPINDPPVIEGMPDTFFVHYDVDYSYDLKPYVSDKDNATEDLFLTLTDYYIRTAPLNHLELIMNYPESMVGLEVPVILVVSDGIDIASKTITVKVTENWPPELINELPDISFYEDEIITSAFNLNDYFSDRDSNTLFYTYGQEHVNVTIHLDDTVDFFADKNWHGVETVTFRATDLTSAFKESMITVKVIPVNDPPRIKQLPELTGIVKQLIKFDLTDYIEDVDNDLSELEIVIESENSDILIVGRELVIYTDTPGVDELIITVSDGHDEDVGTLLINIKPEKSLAQDDFIKFLMSILWALILVIIIIITLTSYAFWRKYTGNYAIDEIFWIYNDGALISNIIAKKTVAQKNKELVSSMLTGISDLTQDAFAGEMTKENIWTIKEIQMLGKNVLLDRGEYSFIATVFSGSSGKKLHRKSRDALNTLEKRYQEILEDWDGNIKKLQHSKRVLKRILASK